MFRDAKESDRMLHSSQVRKLQAEVYLRETTFRCYQLKHLDRQATEHVGQCPGDCVQSARDSFIHCMQCRA